MKKIIALIVKAIKILASPEEDVEKCCGNCGACGTSWCKSICSPTDLSEWIPKD